MHDALGEQFELTDSVRETFQETTGLDGRIHFYVHPNPENKILHTALVGEMNGLAHTATLGTPHEEKWAKFGGPRAFTKWVQPEPTPVVTEQPPKGQAPAELQSREMSELPKRPANAVGGVEFIKSIEGLGLNDREAAILREITSGNFPDFLRWFKTVQIRGTLNSGAGREVVGTLEVMPDYLSIGGRDWVRMPMRPQTAQKIADQFGCILPTRKIVDAIDTQAEIHLEPHPLTQARESVATFLEHHHLIESQRGSRPAGPLTVGIKKDIVLTPRIFERSGRSG
jgi:hypothetical protein